MKVRIRTILVWSILNDKWHKELRDDEKTIGDMMPLVEALFPGINYFSIPGFTTVLNQRGKPALKKLFPELLTTPEEQILADAMTEVPEFLPSRGYQWEEDTKWGAKFDELLKAA